MVTAVSSVVLGLSALLVDRLGRSFDYHDSEGRYDLALFSLWGGILAAFAFLISGIVLVVNLSDARPTP